MSDQEYRIKVFNQIFMEFIDGLISLYPGDSGLLLARTGVSAINWATPAELPKQYYLAIKEFEGEILAKNEAFFLHESFTSAFGDDEYILNEIKRVVSIWKDPKTTTDTKRMIWGYLVKLTKLAKTIKMV